MAGLRGVHDASGLVRVVRDEDENFHSGIHQLLGLLQLQFIVSLSGFHEDFGAQLLGALLEDVEIRLPALDFERVHQVTDFKRRVLDRRSLRLSEARREKRFARYR